MNDIRQVKTRRTRILILTLLSVVLLAPALFFGISGFLLPAQYDETFLGELGEKVSLLKSAGEKPRIVLVGGSGVAFGYDSELIEQYLPDYQVVNFGMYAGLGTGIMMDLSEPFIREGDLVILSPEQNSQTLSDYFGADYFWQAADGNPSLLCLVRREYREQLAGAFPKFAWEKFFYVLSGKKPETDEIYRKSSFNEYGDVDNPACAVNTMTLGYDPNTPVIFDETVLSEDFVEDMNAYAERLQEKGSVLWYRFCPVNALALEEEADIGSYYELLSQKLDFPAAGNPQNSVMDPEWFFDTNFHLNTSGKTVNTVQLIRDIKAMLGDDSPVEITLPEKPARTWTAAADSEYAESAKNADHILTAEEYAGNQELTEVTIPADITLIEDYAFDGCTSLSRIILEQTDPTLCQVGEHLLDGCSADIYVPEESLTRYRLNYSWSVFADRIKSR